MTGPLVRAVSVKGQKTPVPVCHKKLQVGLKQLESKASIQGQYPQACFYEENVKLAASKAVSSKLLSFQTKNHFVAFIGLKLKAFTLHSRLSVDDMLL